jgi:hypothetical protein
MTAAAAARVEAKSQAGADAAASDAARDARAEALAQTANGKVTGVSKAIADKATRNGWYHFVVDVWITNFNRFEFGLYKT